MILDPILKIADSSTPQSTAGIKKISLLIARQEIPGKRDNMILKTINNPKISKLTKQIHEVQVPPLCPKTASPIAGSTLSITYLPGQRLLEVYSLNEYVASFIGSNQVRDLELLTQVVARDCRKVLGVTVSVTGKYVLNIGQTIVCEAQSKPGRKTKF